MALKTFANPDVEKVRVKRSWAKRGPYWDMYADEWAKLATHFNQLLLDAAKIESGHCVLDLASGAGEPALTIAKMVAPNGMVYATDLVEEMLAGARRRALVEQLETIHFAYADMESLPFPRNSFDRVTARFGLMFCPRALQALEEMFRVLKPGGRVALMEWGALENNTEFEIFFDAAEQVFGDDPDVELKSHFRFGGKNDLWKPMKSVGFSGVVEFDHHFTAHPRLGKPFWAGHRDMVLGNRLSSATAEEKAALEEALSAGFKDHSEDGLCNLKVHVRVAIGDKI